MLGAQRQLYNNIPEIWNGIEGDLYWNGWKRSMKNDLAEGSERKDLV